MGLATVLTVKTAADSGTSWETAAIRVCCLPTPASLVPTSWLPVQSHHFYSFLGGLQSCSFKCFLLIMGAKRKGTEMALVAITVEASPAFPEDYWKRHSVLAKHLILLIPWKYPVVPLPRYFLCTLSSHPDYCMYNCEI